METIKEYYTSTFPTDELGAELSDGATFDTLFTILFIREDIYDYIGVFDTVIRERLFQRLAIIKSITYDDVYYQWLLDPIN